MTSVRKWVEDPGDEEKTVRPQSTEREFKAEKFPSMAYDRQLGASR
jgi:hypothetical protein